MRGLILAAGRGSRMDALTCDRPKCLLELEGRPLIEWQINALKKAGVVDVAVVTGYSFERLKPFGTEKFHNVRWAETNMVQSLVCASEWLETGECIVSYSDIVYAPAVVEKLLAGRSDFTIIYDQIWRSQWEARFEDPLSDAETFRLDSLANLAEIGNKPLSMNEIEGQYIGLMRFTPGSWRHFSHYISKLTTTKKDQISMTELLSMLIKNRYSIATVPTRGQWFEVDTPFDLKICHEWLQTGLLDLA